MNLAFQNLRAEHLSGFTLPHQNATIITGLLMYLNGTDSAAKRKLCYSQSEDSIHHRKPHLASTARSISKMWGFRMLQNTLLIVRRSIRVAVVVGHGRRFLRRVVGIVRCTRRVVLARECERAAGHFVVRPYKWWGHIVRGGGFLGLVWFLGRSGRLRLWRWRWNGHNLRFPVNLLGLPHHFVAVGTVSCACHHIHPIRTSVHSNVEHTYTDSHKKINQLSCRIVTSEPLRRNFVESSTESSAPANYLDLDDKFDGEFEGV